MTSKCRFVLTLIAVFSFTILATAQDAVLSGIVTDAVTNEPVIGATITTADYGTVTEIDGSYSLQLAPGDYDIEFSYIGMKTLNQSVSLRFSEQQNLDITLEADILTLDMPVVTAGKHEQNQSEVVVAIAVLQPALIETVNASSVDEVINKTPGVDIIDGQPNIRGGAGYSFGAGSRVLLLIDDIPAIAADAGFPNWNDIPVENIDQIEIVKGAASALYGSSAMNGIINIRTAYAKSEPETSFSTFYKHYATPQREDIAWWKSDQQIITTNEDATVDTTIHTPKILGNKRGFNRPSELGFSASHRQKFGKLDLTLGGYYLRSDGYNRQTYNRYGRFNIATRYRITDRLSVGLNTNYNRGRGGNFFFWDNSEEGILTGSPGTFNGSNITRYTIDPFVTYFDKSGNKHKLMGRYYNVGNNNANNRASFSRLSYGEYQFQKTMEDFDLVLTSGIVGIHTDIKAQLYGDTVYTSDNLAGYLQLDKKVGDRLNLSLGGRYEWNRLQSPQQIIIEPTFATADTIFIKDGEETDGRAVFRLGANYRISKYTTIRGSWGQGYRYPTVAEKFITTALGPTEIVPNPTLRPETGWTAELGLWQGWKVSGVKGFIDFSLFYSEYQDMMEFGIDPKYGLAFNSKNVGNTRIYGTDISIIGTGNIGNLSTTLMMGYTYIVPKFQEWDERGDDLSISDIQDFSIESQQSLLNNFNSSSDQNVLKYRFEHTFKTDIEFEYKKFTFGGSYNLYSEMTAIDEIFLQLIDGLEEFRAINGGPFGILGLRAGYNINDTFKVSLIGANMLNKEYTFRPALVSAPLNVSLRVDAKF